VKHRCTIFHGRLGLLRFPYKRRWDILHRTCVFASGEIHGSCSTFRCDRGVKHRRISFHPRVAHCCFHKMRTRTRYAEFVFLHPMGYVGHVVNSGASRVQNGDTIFSCSGGTVTD
jgi:hypothetical protein